MYVNCYIPLSITYPVSLYKANLTSSILKYIDFRMILNDDVLRRIFLFVACDENGNKSVDGFVSLLGWALIFKIIKTLTLALRNTCTRFQRIVDSTNWTNLKIKVKKNDLKNGYISKYKEINILADHNSIKINFDLRELVS